MVKCISSSVDTIDLVYQMFCIVFPNPMMSISGLLLKEQMYGVLSLDHFRRSSLVFERRKNKKACYILIEG